MGSRISSSLDTEVMQIAIKARQHLNDVQIPNYDRQATYELLKSTRDYAVNAMNRVEDIKFIDDMIKTYEQQRAGMYGKKEGN